MAQILVAADVLKGNSMKLKGIEVREPIFEIAETGAKLNGRRVDLVVELANGKEIRVELKNFQSHTWRPALRKMMSTTVAEAGEEAAEEVVAGQLLSDLVKYMKNGNSGRQLWFTPDVIPGAKNATEPLNPEIMAKQEDEIIEYIEELVSENEDFIARHYFNISLTGPEATKIGRDAWKDIREDLSDALTGGGVDGEKFVKVYPFNQISG